MEYLTRGWSRPRKLGGSSSTLGEKECQKVNNGALENLIEGKQWSPGEFVRYMAGNCDSEALLGKFREEHFVGNAVEYLEKRTTCWQIPVIGHDRTMTEIAYPVEGMQKKHADIAMMSGKGETWAMFLEAKWIQIKTGKDSGGRGPGDFFTEILEAVLRLSLLENKNIKGEKKLKLAEGCQRLLLVGGKKKDFETVLQYAQNGIRRILHEPKKGPLGQWRWKHQRSKDVELAGLPSEVKESVDRARAKVGLPSPAKIGSIMKAMALSKINEDEPDSAVQIRLWEIIPPVK